MRSGSGSPQSCSDKATNHHSLFCSAPNFPAFLHNIIVLVASASPVGAGHSRTRAVTGLCGISQYPEKAPVRAFSLYEEPSAGTAKFREVRLPALLVTSATLGWWPPVKGTNGCCQLDASTENQLLSQWMVEIFY